MAYNSGFPVNYQPAQIYYPQQSYQMPQQAQPTQTSSIIWVQGEAGAKSYLVAPNTTVQLWDSESQSIYLKSADASGMPSIKVLDYTIRSDTANKPAVMEETTQFKDELNGLQKQIDAIKRELDSMKGGARNE